jgi:hypothetical protein
MNESISININYWNMEVSLEDNLIMKSKMEMIPFGEK